MISRPVPLIDANGGLDWNSRTGYRSALGNSGNEWTNGIREAARLKLEQRMAALIADGSLAARKSTQAR